MHSTQPKLHVHTNETRGVSCPTDTEVCIVSLVTEGLENAEIAKVLGTTEKYIKTQLYSIYNKYGLGSHLELALWYEAKRAETGLPNPSLE
jgi:DNA-binding NarL/FixJ family response regulator